MFQTAFPSPDEIINPQTAAAEVAGSEVFQTLIGIAFVVGILYILFGSFYYFYIASANYRAKESSKRKIKTGIILIVLALGVHLVVNTALRLIG